MHSSAATGASSYPLREQRKAKTRKKLIASARLLFASQGYDDTTLEEIADHAGLHVQTLYRHFPTKQDLATADDADGLAIFRSIITDPDREGDTFTLWRKWVAQSAAALASNRGKVRKHMRRSFAHPIVSAKLQSIGQAYEDLLTESLSRDFDMSADGIGAPRLVAAMLWGGSTYVLRCYATDETYDVVAEASRLVDTVEEHFRHLLKA